ncbi:SDR family NAD(P)-dependent oxidoreductase [Ralstonia nicotianae]|uniref:SDR family NAD(P)-dependent oxidoreductase n=1 Tax=Ralstonia pseudosolanacearum TaxID=1310165 RepID=UPI0002C11092|nr:MULTISPECIES: SDR family oxidoreductase [Ralstonia]ANH32392.1 oxidoreductase [Ralstonia solanacearum]ARS56742.1 oxidoreductase [Ralstonia solanacearum FJAT-91]ESS47055.1 dehydrogenase/reductase oxidoreductase [Ralstonia solanacearum SD54]AGH84792.1 short-chain dehydrogenase/reductase SDR [Ralstonia pseudosolanacearum FQY_4]AOE90232.1 Dehydrogenase/reductase SDR family member 13 [Ralstonia solanacearum]
MKSCFDFRGKTALITGASSGIGREFAYALAKRGAKLLLVARSRDKLHDLTAELRRDYACDADFLTVDLSATDAVPTLAHLLKATGTVVDVLINNAGFATYGRFETIPWTRQRDEVLVNCMAAIELTHLLLPGMQARSDGAVINVASTAAFQPDPYMAIYGATKAFLLSFSEAVWAENRHRGIRVLALCPGATQTGFFDVVGAKEAAVGAPMPAASVVQDALWALDRNRSYRIVGTQNRLLANLQRLLSREMSARLVEKILRPRGAQELETGDTSA